MNQKSTSAQVVHAVEQAGLAGATAVEIAGWTGMALGVVEALLRGLRRQGLITRTPRTRATPTGHLAPVYVKEAA